MHRKPVNSRSLAVIGYDQTSLLLEIKFRISGRIYAFYEVQKELYRDFMEAKSKGYFFKKFIKDKYPSIKIK